MQIYMQPTADSRTALAADLQLIGVGAGTFLGLRRIFAQILLNVPEKYIKMSDFNKNLNSGAK